MNTHLLMIFKVEEKEMIENCISHTFLVDIKQLISTKNRISYEI